MDMTARFKAYRAMNREIDLQIERLEQMENCLQLCQRLLVVAEYPLLVVVVFFIEIRLSSVCNEKHVFPVL